MKIIDLLNKIANGEEVPKHIHIRDVDSYTWQKDVKAYWSDRDENNLLSDLDLSSTYLKEEVEILEEEKKIPERVPNAEIFEEPKLNNIELSNIALTNKEDIRIIKDTLNKVLDYLNSKGE